MVTTMKLAAICSARRRGSGSSAMLRRMATNSSPTSGCWLGTVLRIAFSASRFACTDWRSAPARTSAWTEGDAPSTDTTRLSSPAATNPSDFSRLSSKPLVIIWVLAPNSFAMATISTMSGCSGGSPKPQKLT